jgi:hypothetical protein
MGQGQMYIRENEFLEVPNKTTSHKQLRLFDF